jgi:protein-S-isoprenylcysteine O-methyltransferase Ste14
MQFLSKNIWVVFFISELALLLFRRSSKSGSPGRKDRYSLPILWVITAVSLSVGGGLVWTQPWSGTKDQVALAGLTLFLAGAILRWSAIYQLGKSFTVDVSVRSDQQLKTDGLYRWVRHPSYSGFLLIVAGMALGTCRLLSFVVILIPICCAMFYRISVEERALAESFGDNYEQYRRKTKRIIPGIY